MFLLVATSKQAAEQALARYCSLETGGNKDHATELDLRRRQRTSIFPWRGQFSPDLVRLLLKGSAKGTRVLDPFMGSGTVLFESLRLGFSAAGSEINPAAFLFARLAEVASAPRAARQCWSIEAERYLTDRLLGQDGTSFVEPQKLTDGSSCLNPQVNHMLEASYLLGCGQRSDVTKGGLMAALQEVAMRLSEFRETDAHVTPVACDARHLPFDDSSFDIMVTSPPYINVFNYHQYFRPAVEKLGYRPLRIATSEIGSNRKHRQNRLLTVVQYCLDMALALGEMARVLRSGSHAVVVIGRESRVRKLPFNNGALLGSLVLQSESFALERRTERKFTSRFGGVIYEDLLFLRRGAAASVAIDSDASRAVGVHALERAKRADLEPDVTEDLEAAIAQSSIVRPSPSVVAANAGLVGTQDRVACSG